MGYRSSPGGRVGVRRAAAVLCAAFGCGLAAAQSAGSGVDLNGDGVVNDRDVVEWYRAYFARASMSASQIARFDFNRDGQLGGHDLNEFGVMLGWTAFNQFNLTELMAEAGRLGWYDSRVDFNGDQRVDQEDVVIWLTALVAPQSLPPAMVRAADVNADGQLSGHDLAEVLRAMGEAGRQLNVGALQLQIQNAASSSAPTSATTTQSSTPDDGGAPSSTSGGGLSPEASTSGSASKRSPSRRSGGSSAPPPLPEGPIIPGGGPGPGQGTEPVATVVGTGFGADARAIARWDVVPFQAIAGEMNVGVVAFHVNGIDRVEFSANGGAWVSTSEFRLNPQSGVREYWATLRASDFRDGVVEVRAVAYPTRGVPRALEGLRLYANSRGTLEQRIRWAAPNGNDLTGDGSQARPFRSIYRATQSLSQAGGATGADNGVVMLAPGSYEYKRPNGSATPVTTNAWVTVQAGPGVSRDDVHIVSASDGQSNGGLLTRLVRLKGVTLRGTLDTSTPLEDYLWLDGVKHVGAGPLDPTIYFTGTWWSGIYATDCFSTNVVNGYVGASLIRNCQIDRYFNDAFPGCLMVVNSTVKNATGGVGANGYAYHSDVWQERSPMTARNIILYGVTATENCTQQGVFSATDGHQDIAIVNCAFDLRGYPNQSQWRTRSDHFVVQNNTFLGAPFLLGLSSNHPSVTGVLGSKNTAFRNNVFQWVNLDDPLRLTGPGYPTYDAIQSSVMFDNNHFINLWPSGSGPSAGQAIWCAQPLGTNATTGATIRSGVGAYGTSAPPPSQN